MLPRAPAHQTRIPEGIIGLFMRGSANKQDLAGNPSETASKARTAMNLTARPACMLPTTRRPSCARVSATFASRLGLVLCHALSFHLASFVSSCRSFKKPSWCPAARRSEAGTGSNTSQMIQNVNVDLTPHVASLAKRCLPETSRLPIIAGCLCVCLCKAPDKGQRDLSG